MAQMIPDRPSPATESAAELRMFERLRDATSKSLVAFHHVAWQVPGPKGPRLGEADFVIADPRSGVTVVEVKGGGIRYDAVTGQWSSLGRDGTHEIQDPIEQARRSAFVLRDALAVASGQKKADWRVGYAVALPDTRIRSKPLRLDAPRQIFLDEEDVASIGDRLDGLARHWFPGPTDAIGEPGMRVVKGVLANSFELRSPLSTLLAEDERELMRLTERQYVVLDFLARQSRVAIAGCAGSGKTFIAVEKARRLAKQGFRVLLLCFNEWLGEHLRRATAGIDGVVASAFYPFCERFVREHGSLPKRPKSDGGYQALFREFERVAPDASDPYDALLVDEAQDFQPDWWTPLQLLLKDPDKSPLYVFYDGNQRIFPVRKDVLPVTGAPIVLTKNCRNTQRIHRLVSAYYEGEPIEAIGPEGMPIEVTTYSTRKELKALLDAAVRKWVREAKLEPRDIALLTPMGLDSSVLSWSDELGGLRLTDDPFDEAALLRTSVYRFKGLERKVVAMVEVDGDARDNALYVGFSRPSVFLSVFGTEEGIGRLPRGLRRSAVPARAPGKGKN